MSRTRKEKPLEQAALERGVKASMRLLERSRSAQPDEDAEQQDVF